MDTTIDTDEFLLDVEDDSKREIRIYLFRLIFILVVIVGCFFGFSAILCFAKDECKNNVPSLHNMLNSSFSAPFIVTALNTVLSIHGILIVALYGKTHFKSYYGSRLQIIAAILLYILIAITLFVFPYMPTVNYASILIILGIAVWKVAILITLKNYYKGHLQPKYLFPSGLMFGVYVLSSAVYVGLKYSFQNELGIMIVELICGFSVFAFLILIMYHVGNISIVIKN